MSLKITGEKQRPIKVMQKRLDNFFASNRSYERVQNELMVLAEQRCELEDIPAREDRLQVLLARRLEAAKDLQFHAQKVHAKTDERHIRKYFKRRNGPWHTPRPYRYMNFDLKEPLKEIHQIACQILAVNYEAETSQLQRESEQRKEDVLAALQARLVEQSFLADSGVPIVESYVECQEVPHQYKLLQEGDYEAVLVFGKEWIKNPPKEASWEDVESMSFCVLESAQQTGNRDLAGYRADLEQWLKENSLSEGLPLTSDQATTPLGRSTHILGLLYLHSEKLDLSSRAFHFYQACSLLHPDQSCWKAAQAFYYVSRRQWLEADEVLTGPSVDDAIVLQAQKYLMEGRRERMTAAGLDLSVLVLTKLTPASYKERAVFDVTLTALQLLANESFRKEWLPFLWNRVGAPVAVPRLRLGSSSATMVQDVIDYVFRNVVPLKSVQRAALIESCAMRFGNAAYAIYSDSQQISFPSAITLASLLISTGQACDEFREVDRSPAFRALLSTTQKIASDVGSAVTLTSYHDLLPLLGVRPQQVVKTVGALQLTSCISPEKWFFLGVGSLTAYRFYYDYPHLWAACVMQDTEKLCFQAKYEEAKCILAAAENSHLAGRARPSLQSYANYVKWLQSYSQLREDPVKYAEFLTHLDHALAMLKQVSYYEGIRNNLLRKKLAVAVHQQDQARLKEVLEESPSETVIVCGVHYLICHIFNCSLRGQVVSCSKLQEMGTSFPQKFHPLINKLNTHLQDHALVLQDWPQLALLPLLQKPPSSNKVQRWKEAIQVFQSFFREQVDEKSVFQGLQYNKLIIAFANNDQTETIFEGLDEAYHRQFSNKLILATRSLPQDVTMGLIRKAKCASFIDNELIQNYGYLISLQEGASIEEQIGALENCSALLKMEEESHRELYAIFCAYKIGLYLDIGKYADAKNLLTQETTDIQVHTEVAAYLFEKVHVLMQYESVKALSEIGKIIENLDTWSHLELFKTFQACLYPSTSLKGQLEDLTTLIELLPKTERLASLAFDLQGRKKLLTFHVCLEQEDFEQARELLIQSGKHYTAFCNTVLIFLIEKGEQLRQAKSSPEVQGYLQNLTHFFSLPQAEIVQNYTYFLASLAKADKKGKLDAYEGALRFLTTVCGQLNSIQCLIPESLKMSMAHIYLKITFFAKQMGRKEVAASALASIGRLGFPMESFEMWIRQCNEQLSAFQH